MRKFLRYDGEILIGDTLKQTMHGLSLAWSYMPHSWDVKCNNKLSVIEAFNDEEMLKKVITKRLRMGVNISDNGLRKMLKMYSGVQAVSNFRPTSADALYKHFAGSGARVLDTSAGFGGRLLGAIKAKVDYVGFDPSTPSYNGLQEIIKDYSDGSAEVFKKGSEDIDFLNEFDFAFTSPPYFDTEAYSDEPTQSYAKFPTKDEWREGFLLATINNTFNALKRNTVFCLNIQDVPNYKELVEDSILLGERVGFKYEGQMKYSLSNSVFTKWKNAYKYEPVLVFRKN